MRIPHYLTRTKSGFNFRCRVPRDLQEQMARKVIKRTLHTQDRRIAQAAAMALACRYARDFDRMRAQEKQGMDEPTLAEVQAIYEQCLDQARTEELQAALRDERRPQGRAGTFKQLEGVLPRVNPAAATWMGHEHVTMGDGLMDERSQTRRLTSSTFYLPIGHAIL